jgi:membrane-associated phospholipid phosphatase
MIESVAPSDAAFLWNQVLLDALLADDKKPKDQREQGGVTRASRAAAIVHAAVHDAVNGVDRRNFPYLVQDRAPTGASIDAAAAGAAHATLSGLYPSQEATFDAKLSQYLGTLPAGPGRDSGARFGTAVGNMLLMARQHDGRNSPNQGDPPYLEKTTPLEWRRDPLAPPDDQIPPLTAGWGSVRPFTLDYGPHFRPEAYPTPTGTDYRNAFIEVRDRGRDRNRTSETAKIADFWSYDDALGTPVRLYNRHTREILTQRPPDPNVSPPDLHFHARVFALVNLALADAAIGCWDAKYAYNLWRPVHGIRRADEDGNPNTDPVENWKPLGRPKGPIDPTTGQRVPNTSPPFPAYPSGHSTLGTAAFGILRKALRNQAFSFTLSSEERGGMQRSFSTLEILNSEPAPTSTMRSPIDENGWSRIYLGVHWNFDDRSVGGPRIGGRWLGNQIADHIWPNFLRPVT